MADFRKFMVVWLSAVVLGTILTVGALRLFTPTPEQSQQGDLATGNNHFSVVYRGLIPGYSTAYPDYYVTINGLKDDPLRMYIALYLQNQESSGYYFMIDKYENPPASWTITSAFAGYIGVDGTMSYTYSNVWREKPSSISGGELVETINLTVKAYVDSAYTNFYSQDNFTVTYHLIDRASAAWTVLEYDEFEDGTTQGWSGQSVSLQTTYYRSFSHSLRTYGTLPYFSKTFTIGAPPYDSHTTGYLICPIRSDKYADFSIAIDGNTVFKLDVSPSNQWYQFTIPLHYGSTGVSINFGYWGGNMYSAYMDDAYVIAK